MEREEKHRLAELSAFIGFVLIPGGVFLYSATDLGAWIGTAVVGLGLAIFVAGVEAAMKTRPGEDES